MALIKNVAIIVVSFLKNPSYIKLYQLLCFSNLFYVLSIMAIIFYIFWRNNDFNFNIITRGIVILGIFYLCFVLGIKGRFIVKIDYGYIIELYGEVFNVVFIISMIISICINFFSKKYIRTNYKGIFYSTIVAMIFIIEYSIFISGFNIYPYEMVSELLLIGLLSYGIKEFN